MKLINLINESIVEMLSENDVWYHGTPDERDVRKTNSFTERYGTTDIVPDPKKWNEVQDDMANARQSGDEDLYFKLLDQAGDLKQTIKYIKPIFFTNNQGVAKTYADPSRAFDYQNSEPNVLKVKINDTGKVLKVPAYGQRFRMIELDGFKNALLKSGISEEEINRQIQMHPFDIRNNKLSAETMGIIAQQLGFDIVDVLGVLDSYHGGSTKSTVRMVFDPQRIEIL